MRPSSNGSENRPPLRIIHSLESFDSTSLNYWRGRSTDYILDSLFNPANRDYERLLVRADGTVLNGNTRLFILEERGYNLASIPWTSI